MRTFPAYHCFVVTFATAVAATLAADPAPADREAVVPAEHAAEPARRPVMRQFREAGNSAAVPSPQEMARVRSEFHRRFREPLSHADSSAGATVAAETLLGAAAAESDRTLRWLMIDEARRLGEAAGQAGIVTRAIAAASGGYDFDDVDLELRTLKQIPLRGLDASRAAAVAVAAERVALRAQADGRHDKSVAAEMLACRAWQRAGDVAAARRAAARHDAALAAERPSTP